MPPKKTKRQENEDLRQKVKQMEKAVEEKDSELLQSRQLAASLQNKIAALQEKLHLKEAFLTAQSQIVAALEDAVKRKDVESKTLEEKAAEATEDAARLRANALLIEQELRARDEQLVRLVAFQEEQQKLSAEMSAHAVTADATIGQLNGRLHVEVALNERLRGENQSLLDAVVSKQLTARSVGGMLAARRASEEERESLLARLQTEIAELRTEHRLQTRKWKDSSELTKFVELQEELIAVLKADADRASRNDKLRTCGICAMPYGSDRARSAPRVLECGHTVCSGCCGQLHRGSGLSCPHCRHHTSTPLVDRLIVNYLLVPATD